MASLLPLPKMRFVDSNGGALSGGKVYTYEAGTSTPKDTYTSSAGTTKNDNPVILNSRGEADIWLGSGGYKLVLADSASATIWTVDNVNGGGSSTLIAGVAALRGVDPALYTEITLIYHTTAGDGGHGHFRAVTGAAPSTYTDNGGTIIVPTGGDGSKAWLREYIGPVNPLWFGALGDGTTDETTLISTVVATGEDVEFPEDKTFLVDGNITVTTNKQRFLGPGGLKKKSGNIKPIFLINDSVDGVWFDGVEFDGNKSAFSSGNGVPAILGYLATNLRATNCYFHDIIDVGVKGRNCGGVVVENNRFYNIGQNGVELQNYVNDPRTGVPYTGTHPTIEGNHRIVNNFFDRIDDGNHGAGDGCGVLFASVNTSYPHKNVTVSHNTFTDCLRSIWTENNTVGAEAENVVVVGNTIRGNVRGAGTVETKNGIGLIGVIGGVIQGNTLFNVGNFAPPASTCCAINISNTPTSDIVISGNTIIDDTGAANRTDNAIEIAAGTRISVVDNYISGMSGDAITYTAGTCSHLRIDRNIGGQGAYSWGSSTTLVFTKANLAAGATVNADPAGYTHDPDVIMPCAGRLVGMAVRLSAAISAGNITVTPYSNAVARTNLQIVNADFSGGAAYATKVITATDGVTIAAGQFIKVEIVTDGTFAPTTTDAFITLVFDTSMID